MARVQNTLIGRSSGSVGEVVFLTWKLINVTRSKPASVYNPDTTPQQTQRNKFGFLNHFYSNAKTLINLGLKDYGRKMIGKNKFLKLNLKTAFHGGTPPNETFQPQLLIVSKGLMDTLTSFSFYTVSGISFVNCVWPLTSNFQQTIFDMAQVIFWNETQDVFTIKPNFKPRLAFSQSFNADSIQQTGDICHIWIFFVSQDKKFISDCNYATFTST